MFFVAVFVLSLYPCKQNKLALVLSSDRVVAAPSTFVDVEDGCGDRSMCYQPSEQAEIACQ
jgi:hypothetical protein